MNLKQIAPEKEINPVNISVVSIRTLEFPQLSYTRKLILSMLECSYHHLFEAAKHTSVFYDEDWLRLQLANQVLFLNALSEYVSPSESPCLNSPGSSD